MVGNWGCMFQFNKTIAVFLKKGVAPQFISVPTVPKESDAPTQFKKPLEL